MPQFFRGAKPSPGHILAAASPYRVLTAPAPQFGVVPSKLDYWGNNQYGDCVSAEEALAKAWWSTYCGLPETFATAAEVIAFARAHDWLNGAYLTEVMDAMISEGMSISGKKYMDGKYSSADYSNELVLQSAIDATDGTGGPIKIAIDADALPQGAGNQQGWFSTSGKRYTNTDHCVALTAYGRADFIYDQLKVNVPSGLSPSTPGYGLFTWSTIGFVSHDWVMGTCVEAWVRNPTTPGQSPVTPPQPPTPPTPPTPPGPGPATSTIAKMGYSIIYGPWTKGMKVGSVSNITGQAQITGLQAVPVPKELSGIGGIPAIVLLLLQIAASYFPAQYQPIIRLVLADVAAGKTWSQIVSDILALLLGGQANVTPRMVRGLMDLASQEAVR